MTPNDGRVCKKAVFYDLLDVPSVAAGAIPSQEDLQFIFWDHRCRKTHFLRFVPVLLEQLQQGRNRDDNIFILANTNNGNEDGYETLTQRLM